MAQKLAQEAGHSRGSLGVAGGRECSTRAASLHRQPGRFTAQRELGAQNMLRTKPDGAEQGNSSPETGREGTVSCDSG